MPIYNYTMPSEKGFFQAVLTILRKGKNELDREILSLISGGWCSIVSGSSYSGQRWDAFHTQVYFYVPIDKIEELGDENRKRLIQVCDQVMPKDAGYDITHVELSPILDEEGSMQNDLDAILEAANIETFQILPDDIREKGKEMAEVYVYLYCVENSIRTFIEEMFIRVHGGDYISKINLSREARKSISVRKEQEEKNQWLSVRGGADIYYLDFKDLSSLILSNWEIFKSHFPDQQWLSLITTLKDSAEYSETGFFNKFAMSLSKC